MATRKCNKKKILVELFCIFECLLPPNSSNQSSHLSLFFKTKWKLITKSKKRGFRELFLPKNDFKTCSAVSQKTSRFWRPKNQPKIWSFVLNFFHMPFYIWTRHNITIIFGNIFFKVQQVLRVKFIKKSIKKAKKLNSTIFWAFYFWKC